jgi:Methyltransferase domain
MGTNLARAGARDAADTAQTDHRGRARAPVRTIEWVLGDAEELPFAEESFDAVTSNFGAIFAARRELVAAELAPVCRSRWADRDDRVGAGRVQRAPAAIASGYLPRPPTSQPPMLWADEQHARACFAPAGVQLRFERDVARAVSVRLARGGGR